MAGKNKIMQAVVSFAGTIDPSLGKAMDNVAAASTHHSAKPSNRLRRKSAA